MPKHKNLTGMRFYRLLVIKQNTETVKKHKGFYYWDCLCDCGNIKVISTSDLLKSNGTKSCGCLKKENSSKTGKANYLGLGISAINYLYTAYKNRAERKKLKFEIDWHTFSKLIQEDCYYCGSPPNNKMSAPNKSKVRYIYNGIDRINSKLGYVDGNILPCCGRCNYAKIDYSTEEFFEMVKKIYEKHGLNKE